jgi:methylthioribose-1-phosphate isomerase
MLDPVSWITDDKKIIRKFDYAASGQSGKLRIIDQTRLPEQLVYLELDDIEDIFDAIKRLCVRGAPAIGCSAALGLAAYCRKAAIENKDQFLEFVKKSAARLAESRPTAVNLFWALDRCVNSLENFNADCTADLKRQLLKEALDILEEDIELCRSIGRYGFTLLKDGMSVLTHCNAGALATGDYGTALSPIYVAAEENVKVKVFSDETRPLLQGSRLTAWELNQAGIDVTAICDNMAAQVMKEGKIDMVIVGADRIAANGDAANKIGTYGVAILAKYHNIPFYVAAPYSTFDMTLATGAEIPIEQRSSKEVIWGFGKQTGPEDVKVYNPAFDVTPHELITGFITNKGIIKPPYNENILETLK